MKGKDYMILMNVKITKNNFQIIQKESDDDESGTNILASFRMPTEEEAVKFFNSYAIKSTIAKVGKNNSCLIKADMLDSFFLDEEADLCEK